MIGQRAYAMHRKRYPCTHAKACHVLYAVRVLGWTQTQAAVHIGLNGGTVSKIVNRKRYPNAVPRPFLIG